MLGRDFTPGPDIDWSAPSSGSSQQLLRMTLHYMEWSETLDDSAFEEAVRSWIDTMEAPGEAYKGDAWNSYALSLRSTVWMQQLAVRRARLPRELIELMVGSLHGQLSFLADRLETDIGGNHLMKNIKALLWGSMVFEGSVALSWRQLGLRLLRTELARQVLADGVHYERSPSYHAQVFADLLEVRWALGEDPLDGALDDTLARMAQAVADLTHPDGGPALFNDAGLGMAYAPGLCLTAYETIFGRRVLPRRAFAFPAAGYFGLREPRLCLVADCGRIGPDDLPGHAHGDVLSFELSVDGHRLIVDQGVFEYEAGPRRQLARSARSHNTLYVHGADLAEFYGAFRVGRRPDVDVELWSETETGICLQGSHDGFCRLPGRPRHRRRFDATPTNLVIRDEIDGEREGDASIGFLLHPETRIRLQRSSILLIRSQATVEVDADAPILAEPAVWWPDLGVEQPTQRLRIVLPPERRQHVTRFKIQTSQDQSGERSGVRLEHAGAPARGKTSAPGGA